MNNNTKHIATTFFILTLCFWLATAALAQPGTDSELPPGVPSETPPPAPTQSAPAPTGSPQLPPDLVGLVDGPPVNQPTKDPEATEAPPGHLVTNPPPVNLTETPQPTPQGVPVVEDNTDVDFQPELKWMLATYNNGVLAKADYYNVVLSKDQVILVDTWMAYNDACFINECKFQPDANNLPGGFVNGTYEWWVRSYTQHNNQFSGWSATQVFNLDLPAPTVPVPLAQEVQGHLSIQWDDDPFMTWFQVYIGMETGEIVHMQWHQKGDGLCNGLTCTFDPGLRFPTGRYAVSIQAWGPGGYSVGGIEGWATPIMARVGNPPPALVTGLQASSAEGQTILTWAHSEGATQYQVWVGTKDLNLAHFETHNAADLTCENGLCSLNISAYLNANTDYLWYVLASNAAGSATGGVEGWATGPVFRIS